MIFESLALTLKNKISDINKIIDLVFELEDEFEIKTYDAYVRVEIFCKI